MRLNRTAVPFAIVALLGGAGSLARATAQAPDLLLLEGREYSILTNPLEAFLVLQPERRPSSEIISTGLWRGYVATWAVKDERFTLIKVEILARKSTDDGSFDTEYQDVTAAVFPGQKTVVAEWFTGHVIIPTGKPMKYVHMGYGSTYEEYRLLRVERGVVVKKWHLNSGMFRRFRDKQFAAFTHTQEYQAAHEEMKKEGKRTDEEIRSFLSSYHSEAYLRTIFDAVPTECSWDPMAPECVSIPSIRDRPPNSRLNPTAGPVTDLSLAGPAPVPPAGLTALGGIQGELQWVF